MLMMTLLKCKAMRSLDRRPLIVTVLFALSWLVDGNAYASNDVYGPPNGFWIAQNAHRTALYGPTKQTANWFIGAWGIPNDLPPFDTSGSSQNNWARVAWLGDGKYELSQNGEGRACIDVFPSGKSLVNEFDLMAGPNNKNVGKFPQAAANTKASLADVSRINFRIDLKINKVGGSTDRCRKASTDFVFALVLTDMAQRQVLFYQVRLAKFDDTGGALVTPATRPAWFFKGENIQSGKSGQWGFGDDVTELGAPAAEIGVEQKYDIDVLPRLRWLIAQGSDKGVDQELKDWKLTGTYHGQAVFGRMHNDATWSDFSLTED